MSNITLSGSGDFSAMKREFDKLHAEYTKLKANIRATTDESKKATKEEQAMAREAKKLYEATRTPQEQYNQKLADANRLLERGKINQDTYGRAVRKAKEELDAQEAASRKAHGPSAVQQVARMAAAYVSVSKAIQLGTAALNDMQAKQREAGQRAAEARMPMGQLKQLSGGSQERYDALVAKTRDFYARGGAASMPEAAGIVFQAVSAGEEENLDFLRELRASGVVPQPAEMVRTARALQTSMGTKETGGLRDLVSKALRASEISPVSGEEIMVAAGKGAGAAKAIGVSDEELLTMTAIAARGAGEAETGGTVVARLLGAMDEMGRMSAKEARKKGLSREMQAKLSRGTISERLQAMEAAGGISRPEFQDIAGNERSIRAYRMMVENLPELATVSQEVAKAQKTDYVGRLMRLTEPGQKAARAAEEAEARRKQTEEKMGRANQIANAIQEDLETRQRRAGYSEFSIWATRKMDNFDRWLGGDDETWARRNLQYGGAGTRALAVNTGIGPTIISDEQREIIQRRHLGRLEDQMRRGEQLSRGEQEMLETLRGIYGEIKRGNNRRQPAGAAAAMTEPTK